MQMEGNQFGRHIVQYPKEYSHCMGCKSCELVCSLVHDGVAGLGRSGVQVFPLALASGMTELLFCQQCDNHPCYNACPKKDKAMCVDENGIVYINQENCIGCGLCRRACVFETPRITLVNRKAHKCDLCRGREKGPACVEYCPAVCIGLSDQPLPYEEKEV